MRSKMMAVGGLALGLGLAHAAAQAQPYGDGGSPQPSTGWSKLFTPPVAPDGDTWLDCYLTNVSDVPRAVKIYVRNRDGAEVIPVVETVLQAGQEGVARAESPLAPRYCRFVVEGEKSDFRGSAVIQQAGVGTISAIAAE